MRLTIYTLVFFMLFSLSAFAQIEQNRSKPVFAKNNYRIENFRHLRSKQLNAAIQIALQANKVNATNHLNNSADRVGSNAIISNLHAHEYLEQLAQKIKLRNQQAIKLAENKQVSKLQQKLAPINSGNRNKLSAYSTFINNNRLKSLSTVSHQLDSVLVHSKEYQSDTQEFIDSDFRVEYTYNQAHFNNLMTVKLRNPDNSLENYFKYEYSLDDKGNINSESYYEWYENAWIGVEKQETQFDANAYPIAIIWYVWDEANSIWVEEEKLETAYDSEYNVVLDLSSLWNYATSQWEPVEKAEYVYTNEIGLTKEAYSFYNNDTLEWTIYQFSEDIYNANMQILSRIMYNEYYGYKSEFEYDQYLNLAASRDYDLDIATGNWNMSADIKSEYNANKKLLSFKSKFYYGDYINPANGEYKLYTYNDQNELLSETIWNWDSYEKLDYVPYRKEEITRNDSVSSVVSYWDNLENKWLDNSLGIYHKDKNGDIIRYTELLWDMLQMAWVNASKTEYLLDDKANIIEESISYWMDNVWQASQRTIYSYTDKKQISKLYKYDWDLAKREWKMVQKEETKWDSADRITYYLYFAYSDEGNYGYVSEMEFDEKDRMLLYLNHAWDTEANEWKMVYHAEERYNSDDQETMRITMYWDFDGINYFYNGFKSENFYNEQKHMHNQVLSNYDNTEQKWAVVAEGIWTIDYTVPAENIYLPVDLFEGSRLYKVDDVLYTGRDPQTMEMITIESWRFFYTNLNNVSVETINQPNNLQVYPNPFNNELSICTFEKCTQIQIHTIDGSLVKTEFPQASSVNLNLVELKPGVYFMVCTYGNGKQQTRKLIKQ